MDSVVNPPNLVTALVAARGNIALAAERLSMTEAELIMCVIEDDSVGGMLAARFRTLLQIDLFDLLMKAQMVLKASLGDLQPADAAKTYTALLDSFNDMTTVKEGSIITPDVLNVVRMMAAEKGLNPEDAEEAVRFAEKMLKEGYNRH